MTGRVLLAQRINNGQSDVWFEESPEKRFTLATNNVVYSVRRLCVPEESDEFHKAFAKGDTAVPSVVAEKLISDFQL